MPFILSPVWQPSRGKSPSKTVSSIDGSSASWTTLDRRDEFNAFSPDEEVTLFLGLKRVLLEMRNDDSGQVADSWNAVTCGRLGIGNLRPGVICPVNVPTRPERLNPLENDYVIITQSNTEVSLRRKSRFRRLLLESQRERTFSIGKPAQPRCEMLAIDVIGKRRNGRLSFSHDVSLPNEGHSGQGRARVRPRVRSVSLSHERVGRSTLTSGA
jgi:hypothetical protein